MNQWIHAAGWVLVLLDGWVMHTHWLAGLGLIFLIYSFWSICMKTPEDEAFEQIEVNIKSREKQNDDDDTQIYASPWKGLTEYEFAGIYNSWTDANGSTAWGLYSEIEKALKGKNHG